MSDEKRLARLRDLLDPATTAIVTNEMQRGIIGTEVLLPQLSVQVAERGTIPNAAKVCDAARTVGARVVHCTVETRSDGQGFAANCLIFSLSEKARRAGTSTNDAGSEGARLVPELGEHPSDIVVARINAMTPMNTTGLDQILRNMNIKTIVAMGVSVNLGITGLCLSALDHGYQVVLVRDAVAGVPNSYADLVIDNSLSLISTVTTADEVCAIWNQD